MEATAGFSSSNKSRNPIDKVFNCSCEGNYRRRRCAGRNFLLSDFGDVLAILATTSRAMDKWISQLDLAGQKGPYSTLESLLVIVVVAIRQGEY